MSLASAVDDLFTAFGATSTEAHRRRARLYVEELARSGCCAECVEVAVEQALLGGKKLPALSELLQAAWAGTESPSHANHVREARLAPKAETWWRSEAVKLILPAADGDRDLAALIAAQLWWSGVDPSLDAVQTELEEPSRSVWLAGARATIARPGSGSPAQVVEAAFARSRWAHEHHPSEVMPLGLLNLEVVG